MRRLNFLSRVFIFPEKREIHPDLIRSAEEWLKQSDGAGTKIVLDGGSMRNDIEPLIERARSYGFLSGIYEDPEYPLVDGDILHVLPLKTCGWIYFPVSIHDGILYSEISKFQLYP